MAASRQTRLPALAFAKRPLAYVAAVIALLVGCKPDLGIPPSLIDGPQLLDVHATPAEVKPGAEVALEALMVDGAGTVAAPIAWTICRSPKPPAESNAVSRACLDQPDDGPASPGPGSVTIPLDACSLFGPLTPPAQAGQPAVRPRDPDATGGFYQPVRAAARGLAGTTGQDLLGFALVRISCALANAPLEVSKAFNDPDTGYRANVAPRIDSITLVDATGVEWPLFAPGEAFAPPTVRAGEKVVLRAAWTDAAAEVFPVFDRAARTLVDTREALRVSWFTTAGEYLHDRTGRASEDRELSSENSWTAPVMGGAPEASGSVHFWAVLRDSRGGSDFASFQVTVAP
ncbi:MAG: hypothetical protein ABI560_08495 [Myxococcales bacterium]